MKRKSFPCRAFTLIELVIVLSIIAVIAVPMAKLFLLPWTVQSSQASLATTTQSFRLLFDHLSDDIRCADSFRIVKEEGDHDALSALDSLEVRRSDEIILYRRTLDDRVIREVRGEVPLRHTFEKCDAEFTIDASGRYQAVRVEFLLKYDLHRTSFVQGREAVFCSHLEGEL